MNIGSAADLASLPSKTIRYYEDIDLIKPARAGNRYRDYSDADVHCLRFLQRARGLGFTIDECRLLLSLYEDKNRARADVKTITESKIREINRKLAELKSLRKTLGMLADQCHGDHRPDCPILDDLGRIGR